MKKILILATIPLLMMACQQKKDRPTTTPQPQNQPTVETPSVASIDTVPVALPEMSATQQPADTFVRDTTAPLGSPQNPIVVDPANPVDLIELLAKQGQRTVGNQFSSKIDSIRKGAEAGDIELMFQYGACCENGWGV